MAKEEERMYIEIFKADAIEKGAISTCDLIIICQTSKYEREWEIFGLYTYIFCCVFFPPASRSNRICVEEIIFFFTFFFSTNNFVFIYSNRFEYIVHGFNDFLLFFCVCAYEFIFICAKSIKQSRMWECTISPICFRLVASGLFETISWAVVRLCTFWWVELQLSAKKPSNFIIHFWSYPRPEYSFLLKFYIFSTILLLVRIFFIFHMWDARQM